MEPEGPGVFRDKRQYQYGLFAGQGGLGGVGGGPGMPGTPGRQ